jgi:hypothetical protein
MKFVIQTDDEVAGLDITRALTLAGIQHTILSKQRDEAAQLPVAADGVMLCEGCGSDYIQCLSCGREVNIQDTPRL